MARKAKKNADEFKVDFVDGGVEHEEIKVVDYVSVNLDILKSNLNSVDVQAIKDAVVRAVPSGIDKFTDDMKESVLKAKSQGIARQYLTQLIMRHDKR